MNPKTLAFLAKLVYRLRTLCKGAVTRDDLAAMVDVELYHYGDRPLWQRIIGEAYGRELLAYLVDEDLWAMRTVDDIFLTSPIISRYEDEFRRFGFQQTYRPGGMINSELIVIYSLIRYSKPRIVVESGTMNAYSSVFLAEALKQNGLDCKLYCLSLFKEGQFEAAKERLARYHFVSVHEGRSEDLIDEVADRHGEDSVAILVDGPKARSTSWDILTSKLAARFPRLSFVCFDAVQEHIPAWTPDGSQVSPRKSMNWERAKVVRLFQKSFAHRGYHLTIQSNQFCRTYHHLNEDIYKYRNDRVDWWGKSFLWGPYMVDRVENHLAHSYKLAVIYADSISL